MRAIISLVLLFFAVGAASAAVEISPSSSPVFFCDYGTKVLDFNVTNSFSFPVNISLSKSGLITQYADVEFMTGGSIGPILYLELSPGQTVSVSAIITLNRNFDYGQKQLEVTADWGGSVTKSFDVFLMNCNSVSISPDSVKKSACLLSPIEYLVNVTNTGSFDESLSASLTGEGLDYARLSSDSFYLKKGDSKNLYVFFYPTKSTGNFTTLLNVFNDKISSSATLVSSITKCADYNVSLPDSIRLCEGSNQSFTGKITNTGSVADSYSVLASSPVLSSDFKSDIQISSGNSSNFSASISPSCSQSGLYNLSVSIVPSQAFQSFSSNIPVHVDNCYYFNASQQGSRNVCACENSDFNVSVSNKGYFAQNYSISYNQDNFFIPKTMLEINPGETAVIPVHFSSCNPGLYDADIKVTEMSNCSSTLSVPASINVLSEQDCRKISIGTANSYELNELSQYNIPVAFRNDGIRPANYSVQFSGSASSWVYASTASSFLLFPGNGTVLNFLVIPPKGLSDQSYDLVVNVFSGNSLVSYKKIVFSKQSFMPSIVPQASSRDFSGIDYFVLTFFVFIVFLLFFYFDILASFLRHSFEELYYVFRGKKNT